MDDITFTSPFFLQYACLSENDENFITYVYPYKIVEGLKKFNSLSDTPNYQKISDILEINNSTIEDIEDKNPILIEFQFLNKDETERY